MVPLGVPLSALLLVVVLLNEDDDDVFVDCVALVSNSSSFGGNVDANDSSVVVVM